MTYSIKTVDGGRFFFEHEGLDIPVLFHDSQRALKMPIKDGTVWFNVQNIVSITEKDGSGNDE